MNYMGGRFVESLLEWIFRLDRLLDEDGQNPSSDSKKTWGSSLQMLLFQHQNFFLQNPLNPHWRILGPHINLPFVVSEILDPTLTINSANSVLLLKTQGR